MLDNDWRASRIDSFIMVISPDNYVCDTLEPIVAHTKVEHVEKRRGWLQHMHDPVIFLNQLRQNAPFARDYLNQVAEIFLFVQIVVRAALASASSSNFRVATLAKPFTAA
jgi:hypothetical protein